MSISKKKRYYKLTKAEFDLFFIFLDLLENKQIDRNLITNLGFKKQMLSYLLKSKYYIKQRNKNE